jgi:general secretion pathway protein J
MKRATGESPLAGFSLIEAMAALALTATIIMALGSVARQWLPNWARSFVRLQDTDLLGAGVERIAADVSAAEFVTRSGGAITPLFDGDALSVTFVRSATGPNTYPHLEYVRLAEAKDDRGFSLVRTRAPFTPLDANGSDQPVVFKDPVVLVRAPFRISFAYAAADDRVWLEEWKNHEMLPDAVRITVRDGTNRLLPASTAVRMRVSAPGVAQATAEPNKNATNAAPAAGQQLQQ